MTNVQNKFSADITGFDCDSDAAILGVKPGTVTFERNDEWITHKRVEIDINLIDPIFGGETVVIALAPLKALVLASRLLKTLDGLRESGVEMPQLHSRFLRNFDEYLECGTPLDSDDIEFLNNHRLSCFVEDGQTLADILPPSLTKSEG